MRKVIKIIAFLIILICLAFGGLIIYAKYFHNSNIKAVSYYADEFPVTSSQFSEEFESIHKVVKDNYSLYPSKQINMDSLYNIFSNKLNDQITSSVDFGFFLKEYFAALQVGHASVYLKDHYANYAPSYIEGRIFIDNPNSYLTEYGFKDKDEIIAINSVSTHDWINQNKKYTPASTEDTRILMTARKAFRSWSDTIQRYLLFRGDDTININLPLKKEDYFTKEAHKEINWKILHGNIGYISILLMMGHVVDKFEDAYNQIKDLPYLIIDVRKNGGGNSENGRLICEYLIREPQPYCLSPNRNIQPQDNAYKGKIYILTSHFTFSAAESFVLDLLESGNAILIGEPTGGDTGNGPKRFKTNNNIYFRVPTRESMLSPEGFPMEGVGIPPHYNVSQSVVDFFKNKDTVLEFALQIIEKDS